MHRNAEKRPQPKGMRWMGSVVKERVMVARTERFAHSRFAYSAGGWFVLCVSGRIAPCSKTRSALVPDLSAGNHDRGRNMDVFTCIAMPEKRTAVNTSEAGEHGMRGVAVDERKAKT